MHHFRARNYSSPPQILPPISKLDDYEAEILDRWRHRAFRQATFLLSAFGGILLLVGYFRPEFPNNHFAANQVMIMAGFPHSLPICS